MRKLIAACCFLLCAFFVVPVHSQSTSPVLLPGGCGTGSATSSLSYLTVDSTLKLCVNATVSASITGFPTTQSTGTPISVTTGGVTGTLPSGTVVVASNVGATNGAYCKLGASASTSDQLIPPNSWFSFTVGAATQLTCITSTSTTTVNMVGGSGLPTGSGGGGGGSGGGASNITQVAGTAVNATVAATGAIPFDVIPGNNLATLVAAPINAGTNRIGYVSDDPCASKVKTNLAISQNGTSSVQLIALSGSTTIYVCSIMLISAGTTTVALTTGTGTACVTNNAAVIGTTTTNIANSMALVANSGWSLGSGSGTVALGVSASELCMILGTSVFVSGNLSYVQQ